MNPEPYRGYAFVQRAQELAKAVSHHPSDRSHLHPDLEGPEWDLDVLRQAFNRYAALYRSGIIGIVAGEEDRVLDANDAFLEMVGYSRADYDSENVRWVEMTPAEYREQDIQTLEDMFRLGYAGPVEKEFFRKDGTRVPVLVGGSMLEATPFQWISFVLDLTKRKRAEQAHRDSEERYRRLFEDMSHGVVYQDLKGRLTRANPAAQRMLGLALDELQGRTSVDPRWRALREDGSAFPGPDHPGMVALRTGVDVRNVVMGIFHAEEKKHRWLLMSAFPERDDAGVLRGVVNIFEEITHRKRLEDERNELLRRERAARTDAQRAAHSLRRIQTITDVTLSFLPFDDFLRELLERMRDVLYVDAATLFLVSSSGEQLVPRASVGLEEEIGSGPLSPLSDSFVETIASSGRPLMVNDATMAKLGSEAARQAGASVAGVPLKVNGATIGVIRVASCMGKSFSQEDVTLLELVASRVASAVQRAEINDERQRMGRALQESLLPNELSKIPGMDVAVRYVAAASGNQVGGDFYDIFELPRESWAVAIGDVEGKGPPAAATMGIARHSLRAIGLTQSRPSRILTTLNDLLLRNDQAPGFITACLLRIQPFDSGARVTLSSAGHPLPLHIFATGRVAPVGKPGALLGMFPVRLSDTVIDLVVGDTLVLYTDGVVEGRGVAGVDVDELMLLLQDSHSLEAEEIAEDIRRLTESRTHDDQAWVVLRVKGVK